MKIAILGSGKGTNASSVIKSYRKGALGKISEISLFSDNQFSGFLENAEMFDLSGTYIESDINTPFIKGDYEKKWIRAIDTFKPDLIVLAGFMKILSSDFISHYENRIINLHPSLLPSFKGLRAIEKAFQSGVKFTGCTVHWVDHSIDGGKIIDQIAVKIRNHETLESLRKRINAAEHNLLPKVIRDISNSVITLSHD